MIAQKQASNLVREIWKDREKNIINPLAFSETAKRLAEEIDREGVDRKGKKSKNKQSQLRRFYDAIFNLNTQAQTLKDEALKDKAWNMIEVQLHRQIALIHYAKGRGLVTESFVSMMEELIKAVRNREDLKVITSFLEAFMAFYRELRRD